MELSTISSAILNPDIYLFGVRIAEPITSLTDVIVGVVALFAYVHLSQQSCGVDGTHPGRVAEKQAPNNGRREIRLFRAYFLFLGISVLISGLFGHAFRYAVPDNWRLFGWNVSGLAILMGQLSASEGLRRQVPEASQGIVRVWPWIQFFVFGFLLWKIRVFVMVTMNSAVGLLGYVLPIQWRLGQTGSSRGRRRISLGIMLALIPAFTFSRQVGFGRWFNHHDISHLLMALVVWVMFRGVEELREEEKVPETPG